MEIQYRVRNTIEEVRVYVNNKLVPITSIDHHKSASGFAFKFETDPLDFYSWNTITFKHSHKGTIVVEQLILDGIDTEYFVHHGFTNNKGRGNAGLGWVKYYFRIPIWQWFIDWKQNDNSTFRQISKNHQGFIPL